MSPILHSSLTFELLQWILLFTILLLHAALSLNHFLSKRHTWFPRLVFCPSGRPKFPFQYHSSTVLWFGANCRISISVRQFLLAFCKIGNSPTSLVWMKLCITYTININIFLLCLYPRFSHKMVHSSTFPHCCGPPFMLKLGCWR